MDRARNAHVVDVVAYVKKRLPLDANFGAMVKLRREAVQSVAFEAGEIRRRTIRSQLTRDTLPDGAHEIARFDELLWGFLRAGSRELPDLILAKIDPASEDYEAALMYLGLSAAADPPGRTAPHAADGLDAAWSAALARVAASKQATPYMPAALLAALDVVESATGIVGFHELEARFTSLLEDIPGADSTKAWEPFFHLSRRPLVWSLWLDDSPASFSDLARGRPVGRGARGTLLKRANRSVFAAELRPALTTPDGRDAIRRAIIAALLGGDADEQALASAAERKGWRSGEDWSASESQATVLAYFDMLDAEQAGETTVKAEVIRSLLAGPCQGRTEAAVRFALQNVSGVLADHDLPVVQGLSRLDNVSIVLSRLALREAYIRGYRRVIDQDVIDAGVDLADDEGEFDPNDERDARTKMMRQIAARQGQTGFRVSLLDAYGGRCVVTGCDAEAALEAAHIVPYRGEHTNDVSNGLLLRADIHTLFDRGLIAVDTDGMTVVLDDSLLATAYAALAGRPLREAAERASKPSREALDRHRREHGL